MRVDVWVDVMCPWCYLGARRLETAIDRFGASAGAGALRPVDVRYRSFELRPDQPTAPGETLGALMQRRLGLPADKVGKLFASIEGLGRAEGLHIDPGGARPVRSFDAHRALQLAATTGHQAALLHRLFRAHLSEHLDVADPDVLVRLAVDAGMDADAVGAALASGAYADGVRADEATAARMGITGVPTYVVDGRVAVNGAASADELLAALHAAAPEP